MFPYSYIPRMDRNDELLKVGDEVRNLNNGQIYTVVFCYETLTFGLLTEDEEEFEVMSEWVRDEWEIIKD